MASNSVSQVVAQLPSDTVRTFSRSFGHGCWKLGRDGHGSFGYGGPHISRDSGQGGRTLSADSRSRGCVPRHYNYCNGNNHTVEYWLGSS